MPGQLRVQDLVAPGAQRGRTLDALEEVRDPPPPVRQEGGLIDVLGAVADRLHGRPGRRREVPPLAEPDLGHRVARRAQFLEERPFVSLALAPDQVRIRVPEGRTCALPQRDGQLELRQGLARDETGEVQGRAKKLPTDALHFGLSGIRASRKPP